MSDWFEKDKIKSRMERIREGLNSNKNPTIFKLVDKHFLSPPLKHIKREMDETAGKRKKLKEKLKKVV